MLFNSLEFVVFLLVVLAGYFLAIPRRCWRARKLFLLAASYVFYMSWNPFFGLLLAGSTLLDFFLAQRIERAERPGRRRALLAISVIANLGLLGFFKYGNFAAENLWWLVGAAHPPALDIVLPIGISFYTFETLSYSIDVYRRALPACRSLLDFGLFLSFFPHLVAGPIVRPRAFLPQLARRPVIGGPEVEEALARIATGFVKKVILADGLAAYVDAVYADPGGYHGLNLLLAIYAYAYQIYFDFSGYTDIAIGLARLFGLRLPENFDRPYLAASPREFWQRWHISLSTWLRDYLYVPLGGNRGAPARTYLNLMITMVLGGLWHGAAWTFVAWGAYHGLMLAAHRAVAGREAGTPTAVRVVVQRFATFHLVCLGWVLFRAHTLGDAWTVVCGLPSLAFVPSQAAGRALVLVPIAVALQLLPRAGRVQRSFATLPPWSQGIAYAAVAVAVFLFSPATARFIYFQF